MLKMGLKFESAQRTCYPEKFSELRRAFVVVDALICRYHKLGIVPISFNSLLHTASIN